MPIDNGVAGVMYHLSYINRFIWAGLKGLLPASAPQLNKSKAHDG